MDKKAKILIGVGIAAVAWHFYGTARALMNVAIELTGFKVHKITLSDLVLRFNIKVTNTTPHGVTLGWLRSSFTLDGTNLGSANQYFNRRLEGNSTNIIPVEISLRNLAIITLVVKAILEKNYKNHILGVKGSLDANGLPLPFNESFDLSTVIPDIDIEAIKKLLGL